MNFFESIAMLFKNILSRFFSKVLADIKGKEHFIHDAATLMYNIYNYIETPNATVIGIEAVLPPEWTDEAKRIAIANILPIAKSFTVLDQAVKDAVNLNDVIKALANTFKVLAPEEFALIAHGMTSLLAHKLSIGGLSIGQILTVVESIWQSITKPPLVFQP